MSGYVPAIPGPSGPVYKNYSCAACQLNNANVHWEKHDGIEMLLCDDYRACNRRSGVIKA